MRLRKLKGVLGIADDAYRLLGTGDFGAPARAVHIACAKLLVDLRGGDALGLKRGRIEDHADRSVDAPDATHSGDSRQAQQTLGNRVINIPAELLERHVRGLGADIRDRLVLGVHAGDLRLENSVGKGAANLRDRIADVVDGAVGRRAELELHESRAVALDDRAAHFVDAGDATDR